MEGDPAPRLPLTLAPGAMLVAGVLHLLLVESHLSHARGAGLFFVALGAAQVLWAFLYFRDPNPRLGRIGLVALALAPTVLYVITRIWRAPWSAGPEAVDALGVITQVMHIVAAAPLLGQWAPAMLDRAPAVGMGILLAAGSYAGAIVAEDASWLAEAEVPHGHGGQGDAHGGHAGLNGASIVGTVDYYGPPTGADIARECARNGNDHADCWAYHLMNMLDALGAVAAFDALVELLAASPKADHRGHELAHTLGHHAYYAYGRDVELALGECSYEVFQGCIHGVLQMYFNDLAHQGKSIDRSTLGTVCSAAESRFETYTCLHGVGHGVMMHTNYALHDSLDMCFLLEGSFAQSSCYGGVFMENVVAYKDSLDPNHVPHDHGHGEPPEFWVDEDNLAFPCDVVDGPYQDQCWRMQTSLILHFIGEDFETASRVCDEAGEHDLACYASLGRDAAPRADRDPHRMSQMCSYGNEAQQHACVEAFTAGVILDANNPEVGIGLCMELKDDFKGPCYRKTGVQARNMLPTEEAAALCDRAPEEYVAVCNGA